MKISISNLIGRDNLYLLIFFNMEFKKIQLTKQNTLTVVYRNADSDVITMVGANIVHRDLKSAFRDLIPHLVLLTEQRESVGNDLTSLSAQDGADDRSIFRRFSVGEVTFGDKELEVSMSGTRILDRGDVVGVDSPKVNIEEDEHYVYLSDLSLAMDNLKYEVKLYIEQKKWGLKEGTLNFGDTGDPFKDVQPGAVPSVSVGVETSKKKSKKKEKVVA